MVEQWNSGDKVTASKANSLTITRKTYDMDEPNLGFDGQDGDLFYDETNNELMGVVNEGIAWYTRTPPGIIRPFMALTVSGWLACDGSSVSETTYPLLASVLNATIANGMFTLPDLRDKFVNSVTETEDIGTTGGVEEHTLTIDEMPNHNHGVLYGTSGHSTRKRGPGNVIRVIPGTAPSGATGGDQAHNNIPAYLTMRYFIKS